MRPNVTAATRSVTAADYSPPAGPSSAEAFGRSSSRLEWRMAWDPPQDFAVTSRHPLSSSTEDRLALKPLVALAVVAAAFLDPGKTAIASGRLIGPVLVKTGVHSCLAGRLLGVRRRDGRRKKRIAFGLRRLRF